MENTKYTHQKVVMVISPLKTKKIGNWLNMPRNSLSIARMLKILEEKERLDVFQSTLCLLAQPFLVFTIT